MSIRVSAIVKPRKMNKLASVMMNDGSFVAITKAPLKNPIRSAKTSATRIAGHTLQPNPPPEDGVTSTMIVMPANPRIEPIERSNSPPIMSKATPTASIPSGAARFTIAAVVAQLTKLLSYAMIAKRSQTRPAPQSLRALVVRAAWTGR